MKDTTKLVFKSLINNDACIEGGRTKHWSIGIVMGVVAVCLSVLPITISAVKTHGDDFIKNVSYGCEVGLMRFAEDLNKETPDFTLSIKGETKDDKYLDFNGKIQEGEKAVIFEHTFEKDEKDVIDFIVYGINNEDANQFNNFKKLIVDGKFNPLTGEEDEDWIAKKANVNFILLGKDTLYCGLYKFASTSVTSGLAGNYDAFEKDYNFKDLAKVYDGETLIDINQADAAQYKLYREGSFTNWKSFFRTSYKTNRITSIWSQTGLMCGINLILIVFMGLMIFILTRGKKNPFRIYTFWETQKIAYWASLCPAILSLGLGFLLKNFAMMIFVLLIGVRVMWMSMKSLRPAY